MGKVIEGLEWAIRFAKGDIAGARVTRYSGGKIEDSCGCIWCDVGLKPTDHGYHVTARGDFQCTKPKRRLSGSTST